MAERDIRIPCAGTRHAPCSKRFGFQVPQRTQARDFHKLSGWAVIGFGDSGRALVCDVCFRLYEAEIEQHDDRPESPA